MDDYILLFLLILVICIFLYVYNNQHFYNLNDCIINNYKNKYKNDKTNINYIDKFTNTDGILSILLSEQNIELKINNISTKDTNNPIVFLKNNMSQYKIEIIFDKSISTEYLNKMKIKIYGEKKSDYREFNVDSKSNSNKINKYIILNPATKYNLVLFYVNPNEDATNEDATNEDSTNEDSTNEDSINEELNNNLRLIKIKSFAFNTGHKLFNIDTNDDIKNILKLKLDNKTNYVDIPFHSGKCIYPPKNMFKGIESDNEQYINLGEINMKPFNLVSFIIELPDFNDYLSEKKNDNTTIPTIIFDNGDIRLNQPYNEYNLMKDFIPSRFDIDKLHILNEDDKCPVIFDDNKYTMPKIEPMNITQGLNKYLLTIKFVEDKYYKKKVEYLVKLKLIYTNLNFKETRSIDSNFIERETLPLVFRFTINEESALKNNLINKNLKFTENLEYSNRIKNKFINKQLEQDELLLDNQEELNSLLNNVKYEYEKNFN